jgi:hypothetical protein
VYTGVSGDTLTIDGTVSIESGGTLGHADHDGADSFGSLEVLTGATCILSEGVTTIGNLTQSTPAGTRGFYVHNGATFDHNSGTISFTGTQGISPCFGGTATYNDVTFAQSGTIEYKDTRTGSDNWIIAGTLTINSGATVRNQNEADRINCTGDCSVAGTLDLNHVSGGDHNFGSLTIADGGEYSATSGTTTLTGKESGSGTSFLNAGTFTHNNGKVKVTYAAASTQLTSAAFYDLEIATGTVSYIVKLYHGTAVDIYNNLTLTSGVLDMYVADDTIDIHGLTNIASGARCWYSANSNTNMITHHGLVTNLGIFYINDGTTVKMNGGLRQLNTLTIKA